MDKIKKFRKDYNLNENEYPNKKIFEALKENDFEFESTFESLFSQ